MSVYRKIPLTQGRVALVDNADYDFLVQWKWCYDTGYAQRMGADGRKIRMHRIVLNAPVGQQVDHINGVKLDNRRCNLRLCNAANNARNRSAWLTTTTASQYKGVTRRADKNYTCPWVARISIDYERIYLGSFATELEAAQAYDRAAREHHGEFARLNLPEVAK